MNEQLASSQSSIEWTRVWGRRGFTWNPIGGCFHACRWKMPDSTIARCYAEDVANKFTTAYPQGFEHHYWRPQNLSEPIKLKEPAGIFWDSMGDMLGVWVPAEQIEQVLDVARQADWHIFQSLTKNAPRLLKFDFPANVWVGASAPPTFFKGKELSVHQQARMLQSTLRVLKQVKVPVRWMSIEPLSFDIAPLMEDCGLQWVVIGAASNGRKRYQPNPEWVRNLLAVLDKQGIPVFFKGNLKGNDGIDRWREDFPPESVSDANPVSSKVLVSPVWGDAWAMPGEGQAELSPDDPNTVVVMVRGPQIKHSWMSDDSRPVYAARFINIPTLDKSRLAILSLLDQRIQQGFAEQEQRIKDLEAKLAAAERSRDTWRTAHFIEMRRPVNKRVEKLLVENRYLQELVDGYAQQEADRASAKLRLQNWDDAAGQGVEAKLVGLREESSARVFERMNKLRPGWQERNGFRGDHD